MAKKKGVKGKKKKGVKGKKKKGGLSHQEREIFLLTISELEHKIAWRNHTCDIIEKDLKQYREAYELHRRDEEEAVSSLEDAILEQRQISERIQRAIPDAENSKVQADERRARELASKLMQMNEEKLSYDVQLEVLRKKLKCLETYSVDKVDEKIKDIEKQLETDANEDTFLKGLEQDKRREEVFRKEMQDILAQEADAFQDEISGKLNKKFERITEETRWWAETASGLGIETDRLHAVNDARWRKLRTSLRNLEEKKEISLQTSHRLQEGEVLITQLARQNKELEVSKEADAKLQDHLSFLDGMSQGLAQNVHAQGNHLLEAFKGINVNEREIKTLEEKLSTEVSFGIQLSEFIERARQVVTEEVKYALILTYDGPPEERKMLQELRCLFEEATKFIYDRGHKSVL